MASKTIRALACALLLESTACQQLNMPSVTDGACDLGTLPGARAGARCGQLVLLRGGEQPGRALRGGGQLRRPVRGEAATFSGRLPPHDR